MTRGVGYICTGFASLTNAKRCLASESFGIESQATCTGFVVRPEMIGIGTSDKMLGSC
jgi:hypothetical protein